MSLYLRAWNKASASAEALANELDIPRIKHQGSRFAGSPNKTVINWGSSTLPDSILQCNVFNKPAQVSVASDKLLTMRAFMNYGVPTVPFSTSIEDARHWKRDGGIIVVRKMLKSSGGAGILIIEPDDAEEIPQAPLYTLYRKKAKEYRVHVAFGLVIDVQQKCLSAEFRGRDDINWKVRNLENGFIFRRNNLEVPGIVKEAGLLAVESLGLDFGAVDLGFNLRSGSAYAYEVNTAPGLVGSTVKSYAEVFKKKMDGTLPDVARMRFFDRLNYHNVNNVNIEDDLVQLQPRVNVLDQGVEEEPEDGLGVVDNEDDIMEPDERWEPRVAPAAPRPLADIQRQDWQRLVINPLPGVQNFRPRN